MKIRLYIGSVVVASIGLIVFLFYANNNFVHAQTSAQPRFILSWKASSYVPGTYAGKPLPISGSQLTFGADLFINNRLQDADQAFFSWYLDENLQQTGYGVQIFSFPVSQLNGSYHLIRLEVSYLGRGYNENAYVSVVGPQLVVTKDGAPRGIIEPGMNVFRAIPYFFNIKWLDNLSFNWVVNGQSVPYDNDGKPNELKLEMPQSFGAVSVIAAVSSKLNALETVRKTISNQQ